MGIIILLIIGYVIWTCAGSGSKSTQNSKDKEFEDMNLSLKDIDDDFDTF
jgi:hypothetical protein